MDEHIKIFSERLKLIREERNLTLLEIAESLDIGHNTLSQYENCLREPKITILLKLSKFFDVNVGWLIGETDERKSMNCKG